MKHTPDSRVTVRQNFFSVRVVQLWNKLPEEEVLFFKFLKSFFKCFSSLSVQSTQFCSLLFLLHCICVCVDE